MILSELLRRNDDINNETGQYQTDSVQHVC